MKMRRASACGAVCLLLLVLSVSTFAPAQKVAQTNAGSSLQKNSTINVSAQRVDFGNYVLGTSSVPQQINVVNSGNSPLVIAPIAISQSGYNAMAVWSTAGASTYTLPPSPPYTQYRTLNGDIVRISGSTVPIGASPILLETGDPPDNSASPDAVPSTYFGLGIGHLAIPDQNGLYTPYPSIGFGAIRLWDAGVEWRIMQPTAGYTYWQGLDQWIAVAQQHGIDLIYTFGNEPNWVCTGCSETNQAMPDPDKLDSFVTAIAQHADGKTKYWEIWNEPNLPGSGFAGTPAQMVVIAKHIHDIVKSIDPTAQVLSPSITVAAPNAFQWLNDYLAAGGGQYSDIIAFHGYTTTTPEDILPLIANVQSKMAAFSQNKPLWNTEWSWGGPEVKTESTTTDGQAFVARRYLLERGVGIDRSYWYQYDNSEWGPLWDNNTGLHMSGTAYGQVYNWMVGADVMPCDRYVSMWTCVFTRAAAASSSGESITVNTSPDFNQSNNCGTPLSPGSRCEIDVSFNPKTAGIHSAALQLADTQGNQVGAVDLLGTATDFLMSVPPTGSAALTVTPGQTASYNLALSGISGFQGQVSLDCQNAPPTTTCSIVPASVAIAGSGATPFTVNVVTSGSGVAASRSAVLPPVGGISPLHPTLLAVALLLILASLASRRRLSALSTPALLLFVALLTSCGGGSNTSGTSVSTVTTPPGTYTLNIVATSGHATHTQTLQLTVK